MFSTNTFIQDQTYLLSVRTKTCEYENKDHWVVEVFWCQYYESIKQNQSTNINKKKLCIHIIHIFTEKVWSRETNKKVLFAFDWLDLFCLHLIDLTCFENFKSLWSTWSRHPPVSLFVFLQNDTTTSEILSTAVLGL